MAKSQEKFTGPEFPLDLTMGELSVVELMMGECRWDKPTARAVNRKIKAVVFAATGGSER
jgi:hypothetical protein